MRAKRASALIGLAVCAAGAAGESFDWLSAISGDWSDAARWSPNGVPGAVSPADDATIDATGAAYEVAMAGDTTIGALTLDSAGATLRITGHLTLGDDSVISAGTLIVEGTLTNNRSITMAGGEIAGDGHIHNTRLITLLEHKSHFVGSYAQTITGALGVAIDENGQAGSLHVDGHAALGGALFIDLEEPDDGEERGAPPGLGWGTEFEAISFGSSSGAFAFVLLPSPIEGLFWWTEHREDAFAIGLRIAADTDHDGVVGFKDLNAVLAQFGESGSGLAGDADEDGAVGFKDLNAVLAAFGQSAGD